MYDNHYDVTNENDYDSTDGSQKVSRRELNNLKKCDTGYYHFNKKIANSGKRRNKNVKIEYYSSGDTGSQIRDAVTGHRCQYLVGSKYEDLFFSVIISNGNTRQSYHPAVLFYNSPEQYEKHQHIELPTNVKNDWSKKYANMIYEMARI